jgi:tetratricopeptide (TPR) repeat protein
MGVSEDNQDLDRCADFAALLQQFMTRALRGDADLARLTGIPARTIEKWRRGEVRRPRHTADVLKLAQALALDAADTSGLLHAVSHPSLDVLRQQLQKAPDPTLVALLAPWPPPAASDAGAGALATPAAQRHQLRPPVADFAGRAEETAHLVNALLRAVEQGQGAIISGVQGMGGVGKTELAYRVAHQLRDTFPDAQLVLDLRGSSSAPLTAAQILQAAIRALMPHERLTDDLPALEHRYRALLHDQRALIVADDARDAAQVRRLLPPAGSALLITSRARFTLPGMTSVQLEQLSQEEATTLLHSICDRLREDEAQAIAHMCGYLPLALRISAGMLRNDPALDVATYIQQLSDERQRLLQLRDPDDEQLDVSASLMFSYTQLDVASQRVLRQLGVLVADFATTMALAVVEPTAGMDVLATLHQLLRRNLVMYDGERARWRLHDLVRALALRELEKEGAADAARWRYARAAVSSIQAAQERYMTGGEGVLAGLVQFDAERPHIDAAQGWALAHAGEPEGDRLLVEKTIATMHIGEGRQDPHKEHILRYEAALAAAQRLGDQRSEGRILNMLVKCHLVLGNVAYTIPYSEQVLAIARQHGDRESESLSLGRLGFAYAELGDVLRATEYFEQQRPIVRELGQPTHEAYNLVNLGEMAFKLGEVHRAMDHYKQALRIGQEMGDRRLEGYILGYLARVYAAEGASQRAITTFEEALGILLSAWRSVRRSRVQLGSRPTPGPVGGARAWSVAAARGSCLRARDRACQGYRARGAAGPDRGWDGSATR